MPPESKRINPYFFTILIVLSIGYLKVGLSSWIHLESPLLLFFTAVALSAWYGGLRQGLLATLISIIFTWIYFQHNLRAQGAWEIRIALFIIDCTFISFICDRFRKSKEAQVSAESLRQSQIFLDSVIENIPNMIFVKDAKNLHFVRLNKAGEKLIGISRQELIGKGDYDFFPKDQADFFSENDRKVLKGKEIIVIPEEPLKTVHGIRYLNTQKIPILGKNGEPLYLLGISEDITDKKEVERQRVDLLREQAARTEAEKTADRFAFLSAATNALNESLDISTKLSSFAKVVINYMADWSIIDIYEEEDQSVERIVSAHRPNGQAGRIEEWTTHISLKNGKDDDLDLVIKSSQEGIYFKEVTQDVIRKFVRDKKTLDEITKLTVKSFLTVPLKYYGKPIGACTLISVNRIYDDIDLSVARDLARSAALSIANAKLYRKANEASQAKSAFLANISHEIRTPLGAMLGFAELAAEEAKPSSEEATYISTILRNGQQLLRLVDEVLDLSKVESEKIALEKVEFPLAQVMNEMISLLDVKAQEKGLELILEPAPELKWKVFTDPLRLRQILINVIGNALKFTEHGGVKVSIRSYPSQINIGKTMMEFTVTDTGIGLSTTQASHLFQPFTQADSSMTRKFGGTGLGLFLARKLALLLGGDVILKQSEIGKGSQFLITIEVELHEGKAKMDKSKKGFVLLVDDAPDNRTLVGLYLSRLGINFDLAENGKQAIEKAFSTDYDLILMDVQMPEMDGFEAVRILRSKQYSKPIVALTAHAMKGDRERCLREGFDDYLVKPLSKDSLQQCLSKYIQTSQPGPVGNPSEPLL